MDRLKAAQIGALAAPRALLLADDGLMPRGERPALVNVGRQDQMEIRRVYVAVGEHLPTTECRE